MPTSLKGKTKSAEEISEKAAPTPANPAIAAKDHSTEEEKVVHENGQENRNGDITDSLTRNTATSMPTSQTDRMARFKTLQSRASASQKSNLAEARAEASRSSVDPSVLAGFARKAAVASHNLLKAETEEEGGTGAFERKRAWDYTVEESERWDERMEKKARNRDNVAFQDYSSEAGKIYERQTRDLEKRELKGEIKNREEYNASKAAAIEKAAQSGGLEIVETENGELVAIDKNGTFYSTADSVNFVENRPRRENVDRLVKDLQKAEEVRLKKRRDRLGADANDRDVTYINDKNKQFNQKLARFYDRYTGDIRESFERGTAI